VPHATLARLCETQDAFDSVAADYDGPRGNNFVVQDMRREVWRLLDATFTAGSRLIDLGCGTGLDAVRMARLGHEVTATDWSPRMIERTRDRAQREQLSHCVHAIALGAHELQHLEQPGLFDGIYSNLGALNCVPELSRTAMECARLLKPQGALVVAVIGRICPWELGYYAVRRDWRRMRVRFAADMVPVGMNQRVVWTRYWTPRQFYRDFERYFSRQHYRGLGLVAPPPYLARFRERHQSWYERLWRLERFASPLPGLRNMGDHFLMVMRKR
jgi:SAM-dependent methyltransferase